MYIFVFILWQRFSRAQIQQPCHYHSCITSGVSPQVEGPQIQQWANQESSTDLWRELQVWCCTHISFPIYNSQWHSQRKEGKKVFRYCVSKEHSNHQSCLQYPYFISTWTKVSHWCSGCWEAYHVTLGNQSNWIEGNPTVATFNQYLHVTRFWGILLLINLLPR